MSAEDDLSRNTARRGTAVAIIAGLVLIALGIALFFLGWTYHEPAERLATRTVPRAAPIGLSIGGAIVTMVGLYIAICPAFARR